MPRIQTLGSMRRRIWFYYEGSINEGTTLVQSGRSACCRTGRSRQNTARV